MKAGRDFSAFPDTPILSHACCRDTAVQQRQWNVSNDLKRKETSVKKYLVELTAEQREELSHMISTGKASARQLTHARILLKADQGTQGPGWSDSRIPEALEVSANTVQCVSDLDPIS
jgi:hypothetical protein